MAAHNGAPTPRRNGVREVIHLLQSRYRLNIRERDEQFSPSKSDQYAGHNIYSKVQFLYYSDRVALDGILEELSEIGHLQSVEENEAFLEEKLTDARWFSLNRVKPSPVTARLQAVTTPTVKKRRSRDEAMEKNESSPFFRPEHAESKSVMTSPAQGVLHHSSPKHVVDQKRQAQRAHRLSPSTPSRRRKSPTERATPFYSAKTNQRQTQPIAAIEGAERGSEVSTQHTLSPPVTPSKTKDARDSKVPIPRQQQFIKEITRPYGLDPHRRRYSDTATAIYRPDSVTNTKMMLPPPVKPKNAFGVSKFVVKEPELPDCGFGLDGAADLPSTASSANNSLATSFATIGGMSTTTANTSFADTSFTTNGGRSVDTANTSFMTEHNHDDFNQKDEDMPNSSCSYGWSSGVEAEATVLETDATELEAEATKKLDIMGQLPSTPPTDDGPEFEESPRSLKRRRTSELREDELCRCSYCLGTAEYPSPPNEAALPEERNRLSFAKADKPTPHWQVRDLCKHGFGEMPNIESVYDNWALFYEENRVAKLLGLTAEEFSRVSCPRDLNKVIMKKSPRSGVSVLDPLPEGPLSYSVQIELNPKAEGPLFQTTLEKTARKSRKACRAERDFGHDRMLTVIIPDLGIRKNIPNHLSDQQANLNEAFIDFLCTSHQLLGRTWRAFHIKTHKTSRAGGRKAVSSNRISMFATSGVGLTPISFTDFVNGLLPIQYNLKQSVCKAFARLELAVSATFSTHQFQWDQVRLIDDILADSTEEDHSFDDQTGKLNGLPKREDDLLEVMTDGCARISVGAAKLVCQSLGLADHPSSFQARINGSKGIWFISGTYDTMREEDLKVWIEIRKSQLKIEPRPEDLDDRCAPSRWSFDVVRWSRRPKTSELHRDFWPILEDRCVPRDVLKAIVEEDLQYDVEHITKASTDPGWLAFLRSQNFDGNFEIRLPGKQHGLPSSILGKIYLLLEVFGFDQTRFKYLTEKTNSFFSVLLSDMRQELRVSCPKSVMAIGIADPTGLLRPGEIHICFSDPVTDKLTGESVTSLDGMEVLVARDPTLRGSDIQKVRSRCLPELAHLRDTVVFPSVGRISLAAKLQGGDYDGDTFWLCWDSRLTKPFMNAPLLDNLKLAHFGIRQKTTKLTDLIDEAEVGSEKHIDIWLREAFQFKCQQELLGTITNYYYMLAYHKGSTWLPCVRAIADLHDLMIDAAKNGYQFGYGDMLKYFRSKGLPMPSDLKAPSFSVSTKLQTVPSNRGGEKNTLRYIVAHETKECKNILDEILFNVMDPLILKTLEELETRLELPECQDYDPDLEFPTLQFQRLVDEGKWDSAAQTGDLEAQLKAIGKLYQQIDWRQSKDHIVAAWQKCYDAYDAIVPPSTASPHWTLPSAPLTPTSWELLKAAKLAQMHGKRWMLLVLSVARDAVGFIKKNSGNGRNVLERIETAKKMRAPQDEWNIEMEDGEMSVLSDLADDDGTEYDFDGFSQINWDVIDDD